MAFLLDTSVAIGLRDRDETTLKRFAALEGKPFLAAISRVELEGGIYARPELTDRRRAAVDVLLTFLPVVDFDVEMAETYGAILADAGFSRRKIVDRMIAATALVEGMTLVTSNGDDFRDVPGLQMLEWPTSI